MPTDPSDIVERLHSNANSWCRSDAFDGRDNEEEARINHEAAAEITRLRAALAAKTEECARVADEDAKTAREEAELFSAKGDYTAANHYNGYADGCEEVAAAIRAME